MKEKLNPEKTKNAKANYEVLDMTFYKEVSNVIIQSRKHIFSVIDFDLLFANWKIGKIIFEKQKKLARAEYGEKLIKELSIQMTKDYGSGYSERSLRNMRQFYVFFPIWSAVRAELSWTHYKSLLRVSDKNARQFYLSEAIKNQWSTRQLDREIHNISYERYILGNKNYSYVKSPKDVH